MSSTQYDIITFPKGSRFYSISANKLSRLPEKPILYMTLHPSEWYIEDSYISVIELQRDISLLFLIHTIHHTMRIFSPEVSIEIILSYLQKEGLDGYLSSIGNTTTIKLAVKNDPSILSIIESNPIQYTWANTRYTCDMKLIPKKWGTVYPISSLTHSVHMILNRRFQPQIEAYQLQVAEEDPEGTALSILLKHASITYIDAPIVIIKWCGESK